jgi:hypothetical protein
MMLHICGTSNEIALIHCTTIIFPVINDEYRYCCNSNLTSVAVAIRLGFVPIGLFCIDAFDACDARLESALWCAYTVLLGLGFWISTLIFFTPYSYVNTTVECADFDKKLFVCNANRIRNMDFPSKMVPGIFLLEFWLFYFGLATLWGTENPPVDKDPRISKLKGSLPRRQAFLNILIWKRP